MRPGQDDPAGGGQGEPSPVHLRSPITRRRALGLTAAGLGLGVAPVLTGCSWTHEVDKPAPRKRPANADQPLLEASRDDQQSLLDLVEATAAAHPGWLSVLGPLASDLRTHVAVLGGATAAPSSSAPPSAPSPATTPTPTAPTVLKSAHAALAAVATATRTASAARVADTAQAVSGELACVLAAIAAGDAQHATVLASRLRSRSATADRGAS